VDAAIVAFPDGREELIRAKGEAFDHVDLVNEDDETLSDPRESGRLNRAGPTLDGAPALVVHPVVFQCIFCGGLVLVRDHERRLAHLPRG